MAITDIIEVDGFNFIITCGVNYGNNVGDGIVLEPSPDLLSKMGDAHYISALNKALRLYPFYYIYYDIHENGDYPGGEERIRAYLEKFLVLESALEIQPPKEISDYVHAFKARFDEDHKPQPPKQVQRFPLPATPRPGYVYLIKSVTGYWKIGRTVNPDDRLRTFHVTLPFEVEYEHLIHTDNMHLLEQKLHDRFALKRTNGEWFALTPDDIQYIKSLGGSDGSS